MAGATPTITACLARIVAIQEALTITAPIAASVTKAYTHFPSAEHELPGPRVWQNEWSMLPIEPARMMSTRDIAYQVRMQFLAAEANRDEMRSAEIATAFWEEALAAFCQDVGLNRTCTLALLRGGDPTLGLIARAGKAYVGLEAFLDIRIETAFLWS
jgi:hypothetical protein